jgi:hypothetical protein
MKFTVVHAEYYLCCVVMLSVVTLNIPASILYLQADNTILIGRLSTVDLLIRVACFVKRYIIFSV